MVGKRKNYNSCCETCPSKSKKLKVHFGDFEKTVLYWDCQKQFVIYLVFCRICRQQGVETLYLGECRKQIKDRFTNARSELKHFHKKSSKRHTHLQSHFVHTHNITDPYLFQKEIEIAIISEPIPNRTERTKTETAWKNQLKQATSEMDNVCVLNK